MTPLKWIQSLCQNDASNNLKKPYPLTSVQDFTPCFCWRSASFLTFLVEQFHQKTVYLPDILRAWLGIVRWNTEIQLPTCLPGVSLLFAAPAPLVAILATHELKFDKCSSWIMLHEPSKLSSFCFPGLDCDTRVCKHCLRRKAGNGIKHWNLLFDWSAKCALLKQTVRTKRPRQCSYSNHKNVLQTLIKQPWPVLRILPRQDLLKTAATCK